MKTKICFIFSIIFLMCTALVTAKGFKLEKKDFSIIRSDGTSVAVRAELAVTPEARAFGFMERKKIPSGTGMLFVFENDQILHFWMKNTPHPLSIAFITSDGRIKDIFDMTPYSLSDTNSTGYVRYALEVPQGWFKEQNIKTGDRIVLDF